MKCKILSSLIILVSLLFVGCDSKKSNTEDPISKIDWTEKEVSLKTKDSLVSGSTYLSVYSQIYSYTEHTSIDLTATVSIRNLNSESEVYLFKADYFDTKGNKIHSYVNHPVKVSSLETLEIVIAEFDKKGGTGANFVFDWATEPGDTKPIFEAVMISTYGQQGLSFTTQGHQID